MSALLLVSSLTWLFVAISVLFPFPLFIDGDLR